MSYNDIITDIRRKGIMLLQKDIEMLENNIDAEYSCCIWSRSKGFTLLHKLILLVNEYPDLYTVIKGYIASRPKEVNIINTCGWSALSLVVCNVNDSIILLKLVKLFLKYKANINSYDNYGITTLMCALLYDNINIELFKLLLESGANINVKTKYKLTALMYASDISSISSSIMIVELLLKYGADINSNDIQGRSALTFAKSRYNFKLVKLLLEYDIIQEKVNTITIFKIIGNIKLLNKKN